MQSVLPAPQCMTMLREYSEHGDGIHRYGFVIPVATIWVLYVRRGGFVPLLDNCGFAEFVPGGSEQNAWQCEPGGVWVRDPWSIINIDRKPSQ